MESFVWNISSNLDLYQTTSVDRLTDTTENNVFAVSRWLSLVTISPSKVLNSANNQYSLQWSNLTDDVKIFWLLETLMGYISPMKKNTMRKGTQCIKYQLDLLGWSCCIWGSLWLKINHLFPSIPLLRVLHA